MSRLFDYCNSVRQRTASIPEIIRQTTSRPVEKRDGKTFESIREKLDRRDVKLSGMQDIEGCRVIVDSLIEQDLLLLQLRAVFPDSKTYDRRSQTETGYQAVHLVIRSEGARYEVQIRTLLQHNWAEVSERLADRFGKGLKYGVVPNSDDGRRASEELEDTAGGIELCERIERDIWKVWYTPPDEVVDEDLVDGILLFLDDLRLVNYDNAGRRLWAEKAQNALLTFKKSWRLKLLTALERGFFEEEG